MCYEEKDMLHASRSEWLYYQDACRGVCLGQARVTCD